MTATTSQNAARFRSPRRVSITLPWNAYRCLQDRCDDEGRSLSNLAAFLIESSLESSREGHNGRGNASGLDSRQAQGNGHAQGMVHGNGHGSAGPWRQQPLTITRPS